jgi:hypothetical protein
MVGAKELEPAISVPNTNPDYLSFSISAARFCYIE